MLEDFGSIISPIVLKDDSTMGPWKMAQAAMATFDKAEYWPDFFITPPPGIHSFCFMRQTVISLKSIRVQCIYI